MYIGEAQETTRFAQERVQNEMCPPVSGCAYGINDRCRKMRIIARSVSRGRPSVTSNIPTITESANLYHVRYTITGPKSETYTSVRSVQLASFVLLCILSVWVRAGSKHLREKARRFSPKPKERLITPGFYSMTEALGGCISIVLVAPSQSARESVSHTLGGLVCIGFCLVLSNYNQWPVH